MIHMIQEKLLFLYKFLRDPKQIGSLTPSSMFLAKKMLEPVNWNRVEHIAELGAGTGAITKYIEAANMKNAKVLLFEKDTFLRNKLAQRFPAYTGYADACVLHDTLRREHIGHLDCIVSGLPFFNFPQQLRDQLMEQIVTSLKPGGLFIAFQYSLQMKNQLSSLFDIEHIHYVPLNIPPAFVYVCRNR
ncbi:methyltransferase [Brevibacillus ruminantium]|uniref:Methyltransferase n=1 Tax=Brevibacillus ruminantium TaxID=2950604 RepID=A0ABY4WP15_9BACL|nr:methyltransferase [Brevibacillus ruminantium]USG67883.1 methyltransferase [Brevibacillus ruminantium]